MKIKKGIKEYSNGELTVVWEASKCIHAAECVKALPEVYKPTDKPWVHIENATTEQLINQIKKCPSGALSYYLNNEKMEEPVSSTTKIDVLKNGPLMVHGDCIVTDSEGNETIKTTKTTFCRCGASANKPFCDGAHRKIGFEG